MTNQAVKVTPGKKIFKGVLSMTIEELIEQLELVRKERILEAHHDMIFQSYPDIEALDSVIDLIKFLDEKQPSDKLTVAELFKKLTEVKPRIPGL